MVPRQDSQWLESYRFSSPVARGIRRTVTFLAGRSVEIWWPGISIKPRIASNLWQSSCLIFPNARITDMSYQVNRILKIHPETSVQQDCPELSNNFNFTMKKKKIYRKPRFNQVRPTGE